MQIYSIYMYIFAESFIAANYLIRRGGVYAIFGSGVIERDPPVVWRMRGDVSKWRKMMCVRL